MGLDFGRMCVGYGKCVICRRYVGMGDVGIGVGGVRGFFRWRVVKVVGMVCEFIFGMFRGWGIFLGVCW